jgi:hypothetical protein
MVATIAPILSGASSLASAFGRKNKRSQGAQSTSGFAALPPDIQQAYRNYLAQISQYAASPYNQYENNALNELEQPGYGNLEQYMNPYTQNVQNAVLGDIEDQGAKNRSNLLDILGGRNSLTAFSGSSTGTQLAQNDENTQRLRAQAIAQLQNQNFQQAIQGRQQGIKNQLFAGQYPMKRAQGFGKALGSIPGSSFSTNPAQTQQVPNALGYAGGIANALFGNPAFTNAFGGGF